MRPIDNEKFSVIFYDKEGGKVRVNPCEGFDMVLDLNECQRKFLNCKATMTMTNNPGEPYQLYSITSNEPVYTYPKVSCPNLSFDVYPDWYVDNYSEDEKEESKPVGKLDVKEESNVGEEVKLTSNVV